MKDIKWIRKYVGFSNNTSSIFINSQKIVDYEWALALLGDPIYMGEQFVDNSQIRDIDIKTRIPGVIYTGSINNLTKIINTSYIFLPNSTLNYNSLSEIDKKIIDNTSIMVENIYVLDVVKIKEIIVEQ
jgi:hypothetical protein